MTLLPGRTRQGGKNNANKSWQGDGPQPIFHIRIPPWQKSGWQEVADRRGISLAQFIREACDAAEAMQRYTGRPGVCAHHLPPSAYCGICDPGPRPPLIPT